ncbi:MAG: tetratricopeptide repeat protein [Anaerolineae bacterium]|nr:tetratricopeptide repeat protein [Anaerolineae bacterium]
MSTTTLRAYLDDVAGLLEQQALEEVIGHCRHILQHFPKNLETYRILGQALLEKNRHQEASDVFQRVLGALPDDFKAHIGMSACWEELQQFPRALWHMERAFEIDPNNRALQDELKRLMERNRQTPPARFTLSRAALSRIYYNGKLYEQAISELQGALPQSPDRYDLQVLYAQALWNAEHVTQATEQALLVLETLPDSLYANKIMSELWLRASRPSDAKPYFIKVEQLDPFVAWEMLHDDGEPVPRDAFKLPRLQWDVRAAAALATGTPDWMANIGEVFVDPEAVDLSIPSDKRKRVWLDDFGAPVAGQGAAPTGKPRTGGLIDKYTGTPEAAPPPVEQDDVPSWFKEFEKEGKKKRTTGLVGAAPVWGDETPDKASTPALSVNAPDKSSAPTADADWLFDGEGEMPPLPPEEPKESLEVRAADALSWLATDSEVGAGGEAGAASDADWLFGDEASPAAQPVVSDTNDMPETLDWLLDETPSTPKLNKLPTGDLPAVENSADALAWLQTGSLSPDKLPPEPAGSANVPSADSAVMNDAGEALSWLQTGSLSPESAPAEEEAQTPDMDWLLDEASVPPVAEQPPVEETELPAALFVDKAAEQEPSTRKVTIPAQPETEPIPPPTSWGSDAGDNENTSEAFAAWLDANPPPVPAAQPNSDDQGWISELQISDALDAAKLKEDSASDAASAPVTPDAAAVPPAALHIPENEVDEFALMFDNIDINAALSDLPINTPPSLPAAEPEDHPMAWARDLGLDVPEGEAVPNDDVSDEFEPLGLSEQEDPLAWMRDAGLEPPPELSLDAEVGMVDDASESAPSDEETFMASLENNLLEGAETGLDIQSDLFAPEQNVQTVTAPEPAPAEPAPEPAPLLDLSDPDWLNDFNPIEVPDDDVKLPGTGTLSTPNAADTGLDWLSAFGTVEAADTAADAAGTVEEQESVDIGWLNQSAADQVTAMGSKAFAMPESEPDIEMPSVDMPAPTPPAAPEPPKAEATAEDWLASFGVIESDVQADAAPLDVLPQDLADSFSLDALLGDDQPAATVDTPSVSPQASMPSEAAPHTDWLASFGFDLNEGDGGDSAVSAEPAASLQAPPSEPVNESPDWLTDVAPLDLPHSADVASREEDFSSFLDAFSPEPEAAPPQEASASTEALVGDDAEWLSAFGRPETTPVESSTGLEQVAASAESAPAEDDFDNLLDSFISEPPSLHKAEAAPTPSADLGVGNLDWLADLTPSNETNLAQPAAPSPSAEVGEMDFGGFLDDLAGLGGTDTASEQPAASKDDFSDWLSEPEAAAPARSGLDALDFSNLPTAEPDAHQPDLSALMADLGVQPDAMTTSMQSDADEDLAPAAMPDWMASIAPPTGDDDAVPPPDTDFKRTTTPMDAINTEAIEPPSTGPSSTGFTELLKELKAGARPILPPTGVLPPIEDEPLAAADAESMADADWLTAFVEPSSATSASDMQLDSPEAASADDSLTAEPEAEQTDWMASFAAPEAATPDSEMNFDALGMASDDDFKQELDAVLAPDELTFEVEDEAANSTASFDIDSVTDLDMGAAVPEQPEPSSNEDWLSSLGFTDATEVDDDSATPVLPRLSAEPEFSVEPSVEQTDTDNWFGAMFADNSSTPDQPSETTSEPEPTEPTMSSSMMARFNQNQPENPIVPVDPDAPDWLREMETGDSAPAAAKPDQVYNAKSVAPTPDSGNTSEQEEKPSTGFALPKRAPRWSRSGRTGDLDPNTLHQPRFTQSMPVVPPETKPEAPPEKKSSNVPDDDFSNLLNSLLDDSDTDLSDLLK